MALIKTIKIDNTAIRTGGASRSVVITGDSDAVFSLKVLRSSDGRYYNFFTNTFEATYTSKSRLANKKPGSFSIVFPAATSGDTYTIHVFAEPHYNTEFNFGSNKLHYSTVIEQVGSGSGDGNSTITFATDTSISTVSATTIGTSTGSSTDKFVGASRSTVTMKDKQLTVPAATGNYGVFITDPGVTSNVGEWDANDLYWITTAADHETTSASTHDTGSDSTALVLDNVDGLYIGMHVSAIESGSVTSTMPTITAIDTDTLTVTLSATQTWDITKDITFRAYGPGLIKKTTNIELELTNATCKLGQESTTVRTAIASGTGTAVDVNGTGGIGNGATIRCKFIDKSTHASPCVVAHGGATGHITQGTLNITRGLFCATTTATFNPPLGVDVPIRAGTIIYIDGSSADIYLSGTISISKYPTTNKNIYIDVSKIFTAGVNT